MPTEFTDRIYTAKEWDAGFKVVAEWWRRRGFSEDRFTLGRSIVYRFACEGKEIVRWQMTPRLFRVEFKMYLHDADRFDGIGWDRFVWQTKEKIW